MSVTSTGVREPVDRRRSSVPQRLHVAAGRVGPALLAAAIVGVLLFVPTFLVPTLMTVYGNWLNGLAGVATAAVIIGLVMALVIQMVLQAVNGLLTIRLSTRINVRLTALVVDKLIRLPMSFHAARGADSIAQRALAIESMTTAVSSLALGIGAAASISVVAAGVLIIIDPLVGLTALGVAAAIAVSTAWYLRRARNDATIVLVETMGVGTLMSSALTQIEPMKASGLEESIIARGTTSLNRQLEAEQVVAMRRLSLIPIAVFLDGFAVIAVTGVALLQITNGRLEPGSLLAVLAITGIMMGPVTQLTDLVAQAQMLRPALDQVDDILDAPRDSDWGHPAEPGCAAMAPSSLIGDVTLSGVTFGYDRLAPPIVRDLEIHLRPGRRVALVGPSGCGKSTVARLIAGLYRPWGGTILIDGIARADHAPEVLTDGIAMVSQNVAIFAGTVRENITLWDQGIDDEDVQRALEDAQLSGQVSGRSGGLDAVLTEGGANLSGGQRQRVEIARALARNPRILILDEATSALDPPTEALVDQAIRRRGISCLVIAHRLSTIRDSDEILVFDTGVIVERGNHDSLIAQPGAYARLVETG